MIKRILALPAPVRHALLLLLSVLASWALTEWLPSLGDDSVVVSLLTAVLSGVLAILTPLVSSYGVGAAQAREMGARTPADTT